ncbi:hypothetical protein J4G37_10135 [Microvirga sp. 3-52]|nr:hypothetical protein [Microvirga sp. 3-52]
MTGEMGTATLHAKGAVRDRALPSIHPHIITGLVPVIPIRTAQHFISAGWPGRARP